MKGYRVVGLTHEGKIPQEIGQFHYFSLSIERAEWWVKALPLDDSVVSRGYEIAMYGYAIMAVEAEIIEEDYWFPNGEDFKGRIISSQPVKVVNYVEKIEKERKKFWRKLRSFLHLIFKLII